MTDHDAVQRRGLSRTALAAVLAAAVLGVAAQPGRAAVPPDISASTMTCVDDNGGSVRSGDPLKCSLTVRMAPDTENATVVATIKLPDTVEIDPAQPPPAYDAGTRTITLGPTVLGFTFSGQQRVIGFYGLIAQNLDVGTPISLAAELTATGELDNDVVHQETAAPVLAISPPPADLVDSTLACSDVNGPPLLPGEQVSCELDIVNAANHEDATLVTSTLTMSGAAWMSGGSQSGVNATHFDDTVFGDIATGTSKNATATFRLPVTALGGDNFSAFAFITGSSTPSSTGIILSRSSAGLLVSPGPAVLIGSSVICADTNGGILLAGDDLTCTVTVKPQAGHEDVSAATATVSIPLGAQYVSGGTGHDASTVSLDSTLLGNVAAGAIKAADFHLKVASGTAPGTVMTPTGLVDATSVPLGGPVQLPITGNALVVGQQVVAPGDAPAVDEPVQPVIPPIVTPPAAKPAFYKLRAKTIRFVMRSGHRRKNHLWRGSKRRFAFVKKFIVRTPAVSGKVVKKITVPKKGKWRPRHGKVTIKGTRLMYTLKKGVNPGTVRDRFHYTVTDTNGRKVTGTVVVSHKKG